MCRFITRGVMFEIADFVSDLPYRHSKEYLPAQLPCRRQRQADTAQDSIPESTDVSRYVPSISRTLSGPANSRKVLVYRCLDPVLLMRFSLLHLSSPRNVSTEWMSMRSYSADTTKVLINLVLIRVLRLRQCMHRIWSRSMNVGTLGSYMGTTYDSVR